MTDIHSCSYHCDRPECIKAQRDQLRERLAQPEHHELQAKGEHPAPCARHCEATAFQIVIKNLQAQLAQPVQSVAGYCKKIEELIAERDELRERLAQPEQEPTAERAWFTIAELNAWADKKLSENSHWVMPKDKPERDEPPPQRTWVGLTPKEIESCRQQGYANGGLNAPFDFDKAAGALLAKAKEKNT